MPLFRISLVSALAVLSYSVESSYAGAAEPREEGPGNVAAKRSLEGAVLTHAVKRPKLSPEAALETLKFPSDTFFGTPALESEDLSFTFARKGKKHKLSKALNKLGPSKYWRDQLKELTAIRSLHCCVEKFATLWIGFRDVLCGDERGEKLLTGLVQTFMDRMLILGEAAVFEFRDYPSQSYYAPHPDWSDQTLLCISPFNRILLTAELRERMKPDQIDAMVANFVKHFEDVNLKSPQAKLYQWIFSRVLESDDLSDEERTLLQTRLVFARLQADSVSEPVYDHAKTLLESIAQREPVNPLCYSVAARLVYTYGVVSPQTVAYGKAAVDALGQRRDSPHLRTASSFYLAFLFRGLKKPDLVQQVDQEDLIAAAEAHLGVAESLRTVHVNYVDSLVQRLLLRGEEERAYALVKNYKVTADDVVNGLRKSTLVEIRRERLRFHVSYALSRKMFGEVVAIAEKFPMLGFLQFVHCFAKYKQGETEDCARLIDQIIHPPQQAHVVPIFNQYANVTPPTALIKGLKEMLQSPDCSQDLKNKLLVALRYGEGLHLDGRFINIFDLWLTHGETWGTLEFLMDHSRARHGNHNTSADQDRSRSRLKEYFDNPDRVKEHFTNEAGDWKPGGEEQFLMFMSNVHSYLGHTIDGKRKQFASLARELRKEERNYPQLLADFNRKQLDAEIERRGGVRRRGDDFDLRERLKSWRAGFVYDKEAIEDGSCNASSEDLGKYDEVLGALEAVKDELSAEDYDAALDVVTGFRVFHEHNQAVLREVLDESRLELETTVTYLGGRKIVFHPENLQSKLNDRGHAYSNVLMSAWLGVKAAGDPDLTLRFFREAFRKNTCFEGRSRFMDQWREKNEVHFTNAAGDEVIAACTKIENIQTFIDMRVNAAKKKTQAWAQAQLGEQAQQLFAAQGRRIEAPADLRGFITDAILLATGKCNEAVEKELEEFGHLKVIVREVVTLLDGKKASDGQITEEDVVGFVKDFLCWEIEE